MLLREHVVSRQVALDPVSAESACRYRRWSTDDPILAENKRPTCKGTTTTTASDAQSDNVFAAFAWDAVREPRAGWPGLVGLQWERCVCQAALLLNVTGLAGQAAEVLFAPTSGNFNPSVGVSHPG